MVFQKSIISRLSGFQRPRPPLNRTNKKILNQVNRTSDAAEVSGKILKVGHFWLPYYGKFLC